MATTQEEKVVGERAPNYHDLTLFMGQLMQARAILGFAFNFVSVRVEPHCNEPIPNETLEHLIKKGLFDTNVEYLQRTLRKYQ